MRPVSACAHCRERRKRCLRAQQGTSCNYCIGKGLECSVGPKPEPAPDSKRAYAPLVDSEGCSRATVPDLELSTELVDLYFRHVNASLPSLFHRPSFKLEVHNGTVPKILFLGVISLSARFSSHPGFAGIEPCDRGRPYAQEAERLLNLRDKSLTTIQACILLGTVCQVEGDPDTESVYYAIASRMALLLDLPNAEEESHIGRELNRRDPERDVPLPMDEWEFTQMTPHSNQPDFNLQTSPSQAADSPLSLLGYMVKLNRLLGDVNKFNASVVSWSISDEAIHLSAGRLSTSLDNWKNSLPAHFQYSEANISYWVEKGLGQAFLNLHILHHNVGQRLFYQFLYSIQENTETSPTTPTHAFAEACKHHATNLCEVIHRARARLETELLSSLLGHMLVIASTVQLHTLLFGLDDDEIAAAKFRLEKNFEVLMHLKSYWPNVSTALGRFEAFHRACLRGRDSSFRLDRWMLQFMLQFSRPLEDKD